MNSAVGKNVAISAVKETGAKTDATINAGATSTNTVSENVANPFSTVNSLGTDNDIDGGAFGHAEGAFQVQQNRSIDSSTGQNMKVTAVADPSGTVPASINCTSALSITPDIRMNFITD